MAQSESTYVIEKYWIKSILIYKSMISNLLSMLNVWNDIGFRHRIRSTRKSTWITKHCSISVTESRRITSSWWAYSSFRMEGTNRFKPESEVHAMGLGWVGLVCVCVCVCVWVWIEASMNTQCMHFCTYTQVAHYKFWWWKLLKRNGAMVTVCRLSEGSNKPSF